MLTHVDPQSVAPIGHAHTPEAHTCPEAHARPHAPQFDVSVCVLTQLPLHRVVPVAQVLVHTPAVHACPVEHARPHAPQFDASLCVLTQVEPQSISPLGHAHTPAAQL